MHRHRRQLLSGFTLIELLMVLVVIAAALAVAAPSLGGWRRGQRLQSAGDEFLAVARHGRAMSIANAQVHRLYVDPADGRYWLMAQEGQEFVNLGTGMGRVFALPEGCTIAMSAATAQLPLEYVEFYPTGRMQPAANVFITGETGDVYAFETPSAVEGLVVVATAQEVPR
jgi:general secretion pathway protein H